MDVSIPNEMRQTKRMCIETSNKFMEVSISNEMKQTESQCMEEFINVEEPFYVLFSDTINISHKCATTLIPVDYYNKLIYLINKLLDKQEKFSTITEFLLNKSCLRWNEN